MKLTKKELQNLIKEEVARALNERKISEKEKAQIKRSGPVFQKAAKRYGFSKIPRNKIFAEEGFKPVAAFQNHDAGYVELALDTECVGSDCWVVTFDDGMTSGNDYYSTFSKAARGLVETMKDRFANPEEIEDEEWY